MIQIIMIAMIIAMIWLLIESGKRKIGVFENNLVEVKQFYMDQFGITPCVSFISDVDGEKIFEYIKSGNAGRILSTHQSIYHNWQRNKQEFGRTIFTIAGNVMIELGSDYAEIIFGPDNYQYASDLMDILVTYKAQGKEEDYEINIITRGNRGLELKQLDVKPTSLDIGLYYNDDFKEVDEIIRKRLCQEKDKGIILLHGLPGTGKTTYLRHLIGNIRKKVLFVSQGAAENLMNPDFIDLLIDNPDSVLIIEDAENIIRDRKFSSDSTVSNLLNLSDGLLSDCLNVQIICTFNNELSFVDSALMRKGRLIARYEFGKLSIKKAQKLADHIGATQSITRPMTLAEVMNPTEKEFEMEKVEVLGFRRKEIEMN